MTDIEKKGENIILNFILYNDFLIVRRTFGFFNPLSDAPIPQNVQTHANNSLAVCRRIV